MKKIIGLLVVVGLFSSTPTYAHSSLEESSPADGETVTEKIEEISLQFSTEIEESSTVSIKSTTGTAIETVSIEIDQNVLTAVLPAPLSNGTYNVIWDIIGEDGHELQDSYSLTVEGQGNEETEESIAVKEQTMENDSIDVDSTSSNSIMPIIISILAFVAIGSTIFFLRRKKQ